MRRRTINLAALALVLTGGYSLSAQKTTQPGPGACCAAAGYVCYTNLDGAVIAHPDSRAC
jgi:hypothetical protein